MISQKLSHRRTYAHLAVIALTLVTGIDPASAQTQAFDRYDVEIAVREKAPLTVVDAENLRFKVERYVTPEGNRQVGFVCGRIVPLPNARFSETMHSYQAMLFMRDGVLSAGPVATFFKPIVELLQDKMCQ
jgi:hypothetical protein